MFDPTRRFAFSADKCGFRVKYRRRVFSSEALPKLQPTVPHHRLYQQSESWPSPRSAAEATLCFPPQLQAVKNGFDRKHPHPIKKQLKKWFNFSRKLGWKQSLGPPCHFQFQAKADALSCSAQQRGLGCVSLGSRPSLGKVRTFGYERCVSTRQRAQAS